MSHCSPARSSNSGSASHAQSTAPAGSTCFARFERLVVRPSAIRVTRPDAQMRVGLLSLDLSRYFHSTSSLLPTRLQSKDGARSDWRSSTSSEIPAARRRSSASSVLRSSSAAVKSEHVSTSSTSSSAVPSCVRSPLPKLGRAASVGRRFSRASVFSSTMISSSTSRRWTTVPMRTSELEDHFVANLFMPQPSTRISICLRRNSSFCASGRSTIQASTSSMLVARCARHAAKSSLARAYFSITASSAA
mmetsp:Transcript_24056/g.59703  ORF Transcript_24056/g.59703 Transcript_24056/m.59703 type:complete len:248 (+) Transcript_24056:332-1075(+)